MKKLTLLAAAMVLGCAGAARAAIGTVQARTDGTVVAPVALEERLLAVEAVTGAVSGITGPYVSSVNGLTGAVTVATAAQGALADTALQPHSITGLASIASVAAAIAAIPAPAGVPFWYEYGNSNFFATLQGGTGYVWKITYYPTSTFVTFSADFKTVSDNVTPPAQSLAFPFTNGLWSGYVVNAITNEILYLNGSGTARWRGVGASYPLTLSASLNAAGTAVVSNVYAYAATNLYTRIASTNDLARYATLDDYIAGTNLLADQLIAIANNAAMATNRHPVFLSVSAAYPVVTIATDSNRIVVTDNAGSASGAWGTYTNQPGMAVFNASGWAWWQTTQLKHSSLAYYYNGGIPGNWTGTGPAAPGSVHVAWYTYALTNWSTNTVVSSGQLQGAHIAPGSVPDSALAVPPITASAVSNIAASAASGSVVPPSTLTPIYNVATGAVTTVEWSATPRINYIELATPTVITNSLTNIGNCASNATVEVWVNVTATNALAPVWDARIEWQNGVPEMTVTGLYKFALSSACGTRIQARQTWPTKYNWSLLPYVSGGTLTVNAYADGAAAPATTVRNFRNPFCGTDLTMVRMEVYYANNNTTNTFIFGSTFRSDSINTIQETQTNLLVAGGAGFTFERKLMLVWTETAATAESMFFCSAASTSGNTGRMYISQQLARPANELETAAYVAGWRP
jgi:hypothetical protein